MARLTLLALFAAVVLFPLPVLADDAEDIALWARTGPAMRNRVADTQLPAAAKAALLATLADGVRPCECGMRQLRWAWALLHESETRHPKVIVAFVDPLRDQSVAQHYARFALLRFVEGKYQVTSAMAFKRPPSTDTQGALEVRVLPRRDVDHDGLDDIELAVEERRGEQRVCSVARFLAAKPEATLDDVPCMVQP